MSVLAVKINLCNTLFPYGGDYMDKDNERILLANVIGECIKSLQLDKNINQKELALLSGVSERSLRRIERGQETDCSAFMAVCAEAAGDGAW